MYAVALQSGTYVLRRVSTKSPTFSLPPDVCVLFFASVTPQTHADVSNVPMKVTREREACLLGSAILAAVGGGLFPDIPSATQAMVHVVGTVVSQRAFCV